MEVTASLVKELREKTGAGMMDCKKALAETHGDLPKAVDYLRKRGWPRRQRKPIAWLRMAPLALMSMPAASLASWSKSIAKPISSRGPRNSKVC